MNRLQQLAVLVIALVIFTSYTHAQTGPGGITTNLQEWLDASVSTSITKDGSDKVSQWNDLSGNANHVTQSGPTAQPQWQNGIINGLPALMGDGGDVMNLPFDAIYTASSYSPLTVVAMIKTPSSLGGYMTLFGGGNGTDRPLVGVESPGFKQDWFVAGGEVMSTTALSASTSYVLAYVVNNPTVLFRQNGNANGTSTPGTWPTATTNNRAIMGDGAEGMWGGYMAEISIYNRALFTAEISIIENYFGHKYGLTIGNDKYSGNAASYVNQLIGIGKESDGTASPAQNGGLILADINSLANGNYFLAAHDNGTGVSTTDLTGGDAVKRLTRIWFIDKTSSSSGNIKIGFDLSDCGFTDTPANATNYRLLYRSGTSGNFSNVTLGGTGIVNTDQIAFTAAATSILDGYYTLGSTNATTSPLPVQTSDFVATSQGTTIELRWRTESEVNNHGFEIEKNQKEKGIRQKWEKIGFVEGHGSTVSPMEYHFSDANKFAGTYGYRLKQIDRDGKFSYSQEVEVTISSPPLRFGIEQNYPNPFNPSTTIEYSTPRDGRVTLKIYDVVGREVATLVDGEVKAGNLQKAVFDASGLSSGVYFGRLLFDGQVSMKKLVLMK